MNIHIATLYSIIVALAPVALFLHNYYAHAADVERTAAQIILEVQEIGLESKKAVNQIRLDYYGEKLRSGGTLTNYEQMEFDRLQFQEQSIIHQQLELDKMRMELK